MILVRHRVNTAEALLDTPRELGVEIDVRSHWDGLYLHHDPFVVGEDFGRWLEGYAHRLLIVNVKEEGLEERACALLASYGVEDFFFLDQSFPFLRRTALAGEPRCAVRYSEHESVDTALSLAGRVQWVWVDCFSRTPLDRLTAHRLREAGFRVCLASPELQGRGAPAAIDALRRQLDDEGVVPDAVCTKDPDRWR